MWFADRYLTPVLESRIGLRDTCGVHNLHGMPGLLGGIVAAVVSWTSFGSNKAVMLAGRAQVGGKEEKNYAVRRSIKESLG